MTSLVLLDFSGVDGYGVDDVDALTTLAGDFVGVEWSLFTLFGIGGLNGVFVGVGDGDALTTLAGDFFGVEWSLFGINGLNGMFVGVDDAGVLTSVAGDFVGVEWSLFGINGELENVENPCEVTVEVTGVFSRVFFWFGIFYLSVHRDVFTLRLSVQTTR